MLTILTDTELAALQDSGLHRNTPYLIKGVRNGQLSVARHFGGILYQGARYIYVPQSDELIRADVDKWLRAYRRKKPCPEKEQGKLF